VRACVSDLLSECCALYGVYGGTGIRYYEAYLNYLLTDLLVALGLGSQSQLVYPGLELGTLGILFIIIHHPSSFAISAVQCVSKAVRL